MTSNPENRDKTRFRHESKVTLENETIGVQQSARMYNFSENGLYIEADHMLEPKTEIRIGITNSPFAAEPDKFEYYQCVIKWRKPLKRSVFSYGYGIEIIGDGLIQENDREPHHESRQHPRVAYATPVTYESDSQIYEGVTENVSTSGLFIRSQDPIAVGQKVYVEIPLKKKGKIKRLTGQVTWCTRGGFGVKFTRPE